MMHSGRETTKEYEAAYEKAIGYFDDGLADLKRKSGRIWQSKSKQ